MKGIIFSLFLLFTQIAIAQTTFEWRVQNTGLTPGERVVAIIDAGPIDLYDGVGIVGEVIDGSGNWGQAMPVRANFQMFLKLSGGVAYKIAQDVKTPNIILGLRRVSEGVYHLTANCPNLHKTVKVVLEKVTGSPVVTSGNANAINTTGDLLISEPEYRSLLTGNVGINTKTPDAELTVKGIIHSQEVKVDLNVPGPDYVFEEDYPLLPLEETKAYIDQHKHLPGIPSSTDMQQNGVNLLEMNMKLLEKVEELTLHLIEMKSENTTIKRELELLKQTDHYPKKQTQ